MNVRVLFVNATDSKSEVENRYRPLWPAYLAAYAERELKDRSITFRYMTGALADELVRFGPDIVAISTVTQNYVEAVRYARLARDHGSSVVIGGVHISKVPTCLTPEMDVGVIGEGEATFAELLRLHLEHGEWRADHLAFVEGIVFRSGGELVSTPLRPLLAADEIPHPKRSLVGYRRHDYMFTSRGCPFRCVFCASSRYWGGDVRWSSVEHVMEEMQELVDHGVRMISFYDDLFVANKNRLQQLAERTAASGLSRRVQCTCSARANTVTPEVVDALKRMNVVSVGMGLESGNDRVLKSLKGAVSTRDNSRAINLLKDSGIQANASFVIGAPDETEDEVLQTYRFIRESRLDFVDVYVLTPLPGTPMWEEAARRHLVSEDMDWRRLNINFETNADQAVIVSEQLSREQIVRLYRKFRRLRTWRILKALPGSPWLRDLPRVGWNLLREYWARQRSRGGRQTG